MPRGYKHFAVDHCHQTGEVRGLLCWTCNVGLGWYENNVAAIGEYLAPKLLKLVKGGAA